MHTCRATHELRSGFFNYESCCLAQTSGQSWVDTMAEHAMTDQFYTMDEFYTDAQYGDDFGYYSTGRVLRSQPGKAHDTQQFAHFTTYPMALSLALLGGVEVHSALRLLYVMWIELDERAPFRVVEMGAGSGQLAFDIQRCVQDLVAQGAGGAGGGLKIRVNTLQWGTEHQLLQQSGGSALGTDTNFHCHVIVCRLGDSWVGFCLRSSSSAQHSRRWVASFEYLIMERSPALAKRQRERGLRVVAGPQAGGKHNSE
eukprot:169468-Amphidinium_carterae.1